MTPAPKKATRPGKQHVSQSGTPQIGVSVSPSRTRAKVRRLGHASSVRRVSYVRSRCHSVNLQSTQGGSAAPAVNRWVVMAGPGPTLRTIHDRSLVQISPSDVAGLRTHRPCRNARSFEIDPTCSTATTHVLVVVSIHAPMPVLRRFARTTIARCAPRSIRRTPPMRIP